MDHKIINLLDNLNSHSSKFKTKNWVEVDDDLIGRYRANRQIRLKTTMLKSGLCDYSMHTYL